MTTTDKKTVTRKASTIKGRAKQAAAAKTMDSKAKHTGTINALAPIAKEINHKLEQAAKTDAKADDYRLSAAIRLAEAKAKCETDKMNFKRWAEENVTQSFETVRKLAVVGAADDPKLALADLRGKNKAANKKLRDKKKVEVGSRDTKEEPAAKPQTPLDRIESGLAVLDDQARLNVLESAVAKEGMAVVTKENAKRALGVEKKSGLAELKKSFDGLSGADKMNFMEYVADAVGATVEIPFLENDDDDQIDLELPAALKR